MNMSSQLSHNPVALQKLALIKPKLAWRPKIITSLLEFEHAFISSDGTYFEGVIKDWY